MPCHPGPGWHDKGQGALQKWHWSDLVKRIPMNFHNNPNYSIDDGTLPSRLSRLLSFCKHTQVCHDSSVHLEPHRAHHLQSFLFIPTPPLWTMLVLFWHMLRSRRPHSWPPLSPLGHGRMHHIMLGHNLEHLHSLPLIHVLMCRCLRPMLYLNLDTQCQSPRRL